MSPETEHQQRAAEHARRGLSRSFLIKDALFFALLLGGSFLYRFCFHVGGWPSSGDMRLDVRVALFNLLVVAVAWYAVGQARRVCSRNDPGVTQCLAVAFLLGVVSIGCSVRQYWVLCQNNLLPYPSGLHGKTDTHYLSSVTRRLKVLNDQILSDDGALTSEQRQDRGVVIERVLNSGALWTGELVGRGADQETARQAIRSLADDIHPVAAYGSNAQVFRAAEVKQLEASAVKLERRSVELKEEEAAATQEMFRLRSGAAKSEKDPAIETTGEPDGFAEKLSDVTQKLTDVQQELLEVSSSMAAGKARLAYLEAGNSAGLNAQFPWLRLPVAVPGGVAWSLVFLLATSSLLVHVFLGAALLVKNIIGNPRSSDESLGRLRHLWGLLTVAYAVWYMFLYLV